jgi:hypothetical protein
MMQPTEDHSRRLRALMDILLVCGLEEVRDRLARDISVVSSYCRQGPFSYLFAGYGCLMLGGPLFHLRGWIIPDASHRHCEAHSFTSVIGWIGVTPNVYLVDAARPHKK